MHIPVLLNETVEVFRDIEDGYFIDCTLGFGGHSYEILKRYPHIKLIGIDQDKEAMEFAKKRLLPFSDRVEFIRKRASEALKEISGIKVAGILADIGVSSYQLDNLDRGFAFDSDKLDMRMDVDAKLSAEEVINYYDKLSLEKILREYGECRRAKKVADFIVKNRPITSNKALSEVLMRAGLKSKKDLAKVFQAIRIEVNNELNELEAILDEIERIKTKNTIAAIITFHSLEDRIVKNRFKKWAKSCICPEDAIKCECGNDNNLGIILTKKPITASKEEIEKNPRSRSAKLRAFKFTK